VWLGEAVATFGLVLAILLLVDQGRTPWIPATVGLWVGAGHLFTSSTSFANPAVSLGRMFTDAITGVAPSSALWFVLFQILGALLAWGVARVLAPRPS
jgi:glycerol uptake facilitator-like aquaporin